ncbi:squalene cyclase [Rhizobium lentis]|uniref:squalene cyclase n=1 Tax=Rhizobium lentis TaxID=1138194 RepID=UPI001C82C5E0|nr:squalene cyclase [Rhizobium lentis]MBX4975228.1 squalene cyclase [Rhizobium lentis]MBX5044501.1 squalene cyclase [Rhizobium lentis]MBX5056573.1 squalene cyclase [Rhizobium lentis]MBX5074629.1 squalene cyclase [Rhizobium lentis]MBX5085576.1 squalene cyclase [Rhizobium lentis]
MARSDSVIEWLLDSDPAIRWQVMRDLIDAPEPEWMAERAKVETEGWGAKLLSFQDEDGQWAGGAFLPAGFDPHEWREQGQPWTATTFSLSQLREFGLDPSSERARRTVASIGVSARWEEGGQPYWEGEVEECINGRTVADGAYFGIDVSSIVERLAGERLDDGGWNCERARGSVRSSFASTINVLEGLLEFEKSTGGTPRSREARSTGEEFLLQRNLFRRLSTGEPADERFLHFLHPNRWRYDILRALDYFRASALLTGTDPDPRLGEAIGHLRSRRLEDGRWPVDWILPGRVWFHIDEGQGRPSRWITLRAMRVLRWWDTRPSIGV